MDFIKRFDIELDKDVFFAGEKLTGQVVVENIENIKVQGIRIFLRGKAHTEWKITRAGERRTVKEDEYYIDDKKIIWGKDKNEEGPVPILVRGDHRMPIVFQLPESALPCSFESKIGRIRYYLRIILDIPYASPPQGLKYFTVIGPHIDCMDERYLTPCHFEDRKRMCCLCCVRGPVCVETTLERSAYTCGENIKLKAEIQNGSDESVWLIFRLVQYVEYFINKGVLGLNKDLSHKIWEYQGDTVGPHSTVQFVDLQEHLQVPIMPPTLLDVCSLINVYYVLKVRLGMEKSGEDLDIDHPITIATVPFRIPNSPPPDIHFECAADNVEGGIYISPEFQFGQVYMGDDNNDTDETILYRPVYVCVPHEKMTVSNTNNAGNRASGSKAEKQSSSDSDTNGKDPGVVALATEVNDLETAMEDVEDQPETEVDSEKEKLLPSGSTQITTVTRQAISPTNGTSGTSSSVTIVKTLISQPSSSCVTAAKSVTRKHEEHSDSSIRSESSTLVTDTDRKVEESRSEMKTITSQRIEKVIEETIETLNSEKVEGFSAGETVETVREENVETFSTTTVERITERHQGTLCEGLQMSIVTSLTEASENSDSNKNTTTV